MAVCGAKPAIDAGIGRGYTGPSSVFFTNDYWPITEAGFQNDVAFFFHERLPYLSNSKNKSFFGSKIAFSFNLKDFAIFQ